MCTWLIVVFETYNKNYIVMNLFINQETDPLKFIL